MRCFRCVVVSVAFAFFLKEVSLGIDALISRGAADVAGLSVRARVKGVWVLRGGGQSRCMHMGSV